MLVKSFYNPYILHNKLPKAKLYAQVEVLRLFGAFAQIYFFSK